MYRCAATNRRFKGLTGFDASYRRVPTSKPGQPVTYRLQFLPDTELKGLGYAQDKNGVWGKPLDSRGEAWFEQIRKPVEAPQADGVGSEARGEA